MLSDSLRPSSLWRNVSEFRGGILKVRELDGWRHRNLGGNKCEWGVECVGGYIVTFYWFPCHS